MKTIMIAIAALLILPAAAHAGGIVPPIGAPVCGLGQCLNLEGRDKPTIITNRLIAGTPYRLVQWEANRTHKYRTRTPYAHMIISRYFEFAPDGVNLIMSDSPYATIIDGYWPERNTADCDPLGENSDLMTWTGDRGQTLAVKLMTQQDFQDACGLPRENPDAVEPAPPVTVAPPTETVAAKVVSCPAIVIGKSKAAVTSTGVACFTARNALARFAKSGVEPAGFVCVRISVGRARAATCAGLGKAAKRVVARWRV